MTNSSNSSTRGGNTKTPLVQISPAVKWCFTFNNYSEKDVNELVPKMTIYAKKLIIGKETGDSKFWWEDATDSKGTPHLQGYVEFKKKCRPKKGFDERIHWEKARGNAQQNHAYCEKEGEVIVRIGFPPIWACKQVKVLKETQLRPWEHDIIKNISKPPDERTIYWYWSKSGNIGKTTFAKYLVVKHQATILAGKGADVRNGVIEYVKKNGFTPHFVIYPIPRSFNSEYLSYESLENVKDMLFYSGKFEGGVVCGNSPHLIVFANEPPDVGRMSVDRWKVFEIHDDHSCNEWRPKVLKAGKKWIEVDDD